jgi:phosphoribosylamine--glycine ligase
VVMAANGYPGSYEKNTPIKGIEAANSVEGITVFHAGTAKDDAGDIVSIGGRVLGITASGSSVKEARDRAYSAIDKIDWPQGFCRSDIAWRALKDEQDAA